jgi:hypothetical protein
MLIEEWIKIMQVLDDKSNDSVWFDYQRATNNNHNDGIEIIRIPSVNINTLNIDIKGIN